MKFSVFTVMMPDCNLEQTIKLLSKHGYNGVEWRFIDQDPAKKEESPSFWGNNYSTLPASSSEQQLLEIAQLASQNGLEAPNLAAYIGAGDLKATEQAMKAAKLIGAPSVRIGVPSYNGAIHYSDCLKEARQYLHAVQELSQQYKIIGAIETHHGNIACSASAATSLVQGFDPDCIGIIYDPGNMVHEGYECYQMGLEIMGPYLKHVHVKNAGYKPLAKENASDPGWKVEWAAIDQGAVHWKSVLQALKAIGYDGWLSFEDFSNTQPTEQLLEHNITYIKLLIDELN